MRSHTPSASVSGGGPSAPKSSAVRTVTPLSSLGAMPRVGGRGTSFGGRGGRLLGPPTRVAVAAPLASVAASAAAEPHADPIDVDMTAAGLSVPRAPSPGPTDDTLLVTLGGAACLSSDPADAAPLSGVHHSCASPSAAVAGSPPPPSSPPAADVAGAEAKATSAAPATAPVPASPQPSAPAVSPGLEETVETFHDRAQSHQLHLSLTAAAAAARTEVVSAPADRAAVDRLHHALHKEREQSEQLRAKLSHSIRAQRVSQDKIARLEAAFAAARARPPVTPAASVVVQDRAAEEKRAREAAAAVLREAEATFARDRVALTAAHAAEVAAITQRYEQRLSAARTAAEAAGRASSPPPARTRPPPTAPPPASSAPAPPALRSHTRWVDDDDGNTITYFTAASKQVAAPAPAAPPASKRQRPVTDAPTGPPTAREQSSRRRPAPPAAHPGDAPTPRRRVSAGASELISRRPGPPPGPGASARAWRSYRKRESAWRARASVMTPSPDAGGSSAGEPTRGRNRPSRLAPEQQVPPAGRRRSLSAGGRQAAAVPASPAPALVTAASAAVVDAAGTGSPRAAAQPPRRRRHSAHTAELKSVIESIVYASSILRNACAELVELLDSPPTRPKKPGVHRV